MIFGVWAFARGVASMRVAVIREGGVVVRAALGDTGQRRLYDGLCAGARGSYEWQRLESDEVQPTDRPWPFCVWRHPYTGETNSRSDPTPLLDWARDVARRAARRVDDARLRRDLDAVHYDSMLSVLYAAHGSLRPHIDEGLDGLGCAVSLGASCTFDLGGTNLVLASGDVLFAPFGSVRHAVLDTHDAVPSWWHESPTFGRSRCSIQLRAVGRGVSSDSVLRRTWVL